MSLIPKQAVADHAENFGVTHNGGPGWLGGSLSSLGISAFVVIIAAVIYWARRALRKHKSDVQATYNDIPHQVPFFGGYNGEGQVVINVNDKDSSSEVPKNHSQESE